MSSADAQFERLLKTLQDLPTTDLVAAAGRYERRLSNTRLAAAAKAIKPGGDVADARRQARSALGDPNRSSRSVNADARRASAAAANPHLDRHLNSDAIQPESIDALTKAADPATGTIPNDLIDAVHGLGPDQARRIVDGYLEDQSAHDDVEQHYSRQLLARRVRRYTVPAEAGRPTLSGIGIEGTDATINRLWAEINAAADAVYHAEGGREVAVGDHTPLDHRRFDAAVSAMSGGSGQRATKAQLGGRPTVVITIGVDQLADSTTGNPRLVGTGPISDRQLAAWVDGSDLAVMVVGLDNTPLWLGRSRRHASAHQFLALSVRDRGCVLCSAHIGRCQAHHLMPWSAPGNSRTDIDQMALLCGRCHRDLHNRNHTLYHQWSETGRRIWRTRPATADETPTTSQRRHRIRRPQLE